MARFKNVSKKPLPVDLGEKSFVVMPGATFEARPGLPVIKKLMKKKNKIVRA